MKQSFKVGGIVTLVTFLVCYTGVRQELKIAKLVSVQPTNIRLADSDSGHDSP